MLNSVCFHELGKSCGRELRSVVGHQMLRKSVCYKQLLSSLIMAAAVVDFISITLGHFECESTTKKLCPFIGSAKSMWILCPRTHRPKPGVQ